MSLDEATTKRLDALSLKWANGAHFRDVLEEAWVTAHDEGTHLGYGEGYDDGYNAGRHDRAEDL